MSGRIAAIDALESDPNLVYVGAATGGVWKSTNGGTTWTPIFDDQRVSGIGAIAINQSHPDIVWVGTGEGNPRNSMGVGAGIYRSMDGGVTWELLGLERSERIHRIVLHPTDPDVAWVGAMGPAWSGGEERGVFKTTDGGQTWRKVLYVNESTGISDLVMDPRNPNKLLAGMWQFRRWPWFFESGGEGSGLYVTYDGGESWRKLSHEDGLPVGNLGRIGLSIARNNPDVVYALVEAETSALIRSDDGGRTWTSVNTQRGVASRPFYYTDIFVDPLNENRVWNIHSRITLSEDGGRNFETIGQGVHSDNHALWINPSDSRHVLIGTDGGVYVTQDRGKNWRFIENIPVAQFYHINVDMATPFNVYGGLQDNGSWKGPSESWENAGIKNYMWDEVGFGDGFATIVDPRDPTYGFAMSQGGNLSRFDVVTGERKGIQPFAPDDSTELRFNWNAAIAVDPFEVGTIYYGSQFMHRSPDRGDTWEVISPDLTTNDPDKQKQEESGGVTIDDTGAENHTTIITIAPSPVEQGVIWVGTDDGNVQVTRDGGTSWSNRVVNIRGVPSGTWVPHIEPSHYEGGTAYVVFDDHRRGNWETFVYRTRDYGESWERLGDGQIDGFAHVLEEDPVTPNLLWVGTEFGLWHSLDAGATWEKWTNGFPTAPARALITHPRDLDLVIGTHGRAAWIVDDVRPLQAMAADLSLKDQPLHLFDTPDAIQHVVAQQDGYHFPADAKFAGEDPPYGALLTFWVSEEGLQPPERPTPEESAMPRRRAAAGGEAPTGGVRRPAAGGAPSPERLAQMRARVGDDDEGPRATVHILSGDQVINEMRVPVRQGLNRVAWNLREDGPEIPEGASVGGRGFGGFGGGGAQLRRLPGPQALPGEYTVRVSLHGNTAEGTVTVLPDPRREIPMVARREKHDAVKQATEMTLMVMRSEARVSKLNEAMESLTPLAQGRDDEAAQAVTESMQAIREKLEELEAKYDDLSRLRRTSFSMGSTWDAPTQGERIMLERMERMMTESLADYNALFAQDVGDLRAKVAAAGFELLPEFEPVEVGQGSGSR
jgi:photosystem II stability/assembly factor-like uncharacterized protein